MIQVDNINQTMDAKIIDGANLKIANKIYVAGAPDNVIRKLPGNSVTDRFVGCLKNIQYSTKEGSLPLTLSKWADEILNDERKQYNFAMKGKPAIGCRLTTAKVLSFVTPDSFVKLHTQFLVQNPGSFSISFFFRLGATSICFNFWFSSLISKIDSSLLFSELSNLKVFFSSLQEPSHQKAHLLPSSCTTEESVPFFAIRK